MVIALPATMMGVAVMVVMPVTAVMVVMPVMAARQGGVVVHVPGAIVDPGRFDIPLDIAGLVVVMLLNDDPLEVLF